MFGVLWLIQNQGFMYLGLRGSMSKNATQVFGFLPGNGIHNIHMNQGNDDDKHKVIMEFGKTVGLIFHFSKPNQWVAIFLKFKSQSWHTKDDDGDPIEKLTYSPQSILNPSQCQIVLFKLLKANLRINKNHCCSYW